MKKFIIALSLIICLTGCSDKHIELINNSSISTDFSSNDKTISVVTSEASSDVITKNITPTATSEYLSSIEISSDNLSNIVTKSLRDLEVGEILTGWYGESINTYEIANINTDNAISLVIHALIDNKADINKHKFMHGGEKLINDIIYISVREFIDIDEHLIHTLNWYMVDLETGYIYIENISSYENEATRIY